MILRAIFCHKKLQTPTNLFLASLAVADLLLSLFTPFQAVSCSDYIFYHTTSRSHCHLIYDFIHITRNFLTDRATYAV